MKRLVQSFLIITSLGTTICGQNPNELRAINNYVAFVNESIHGLLIAHRLFETYNQTVNKYVDLPEYHLNNYSNADLPDNIFIDPEKWFYDRSPYELYDTAIRESKFLGPNAATINEHITEIKRVLSIINNKRITIAGLLESSDLTQSNMLKKVYAELENVVSLYERYYVVYKAIDGHLTTTHPFAKNTQLFSAAFRKFYDLSKNNLDIVRRNGDFSQDDLDQVNKALISLENVATDEYLDLQARKRILTNTSRLTKGFQDFLNGKAIPKEYELYGRHYYFYNIVMLNRTNRYGNGFVKEYNEMTGKSKLQMSSEVPQLYKVIYPEKLPKEELTKLDDNKLLILLEKETSDLSVLAPNMVSIPNRENSLEDPKKEPVSELEKESEPDINRDRGVIVHHEKIYVNVDSFELELYDHLIKDGDRVSININGEWKFKNISLEKEPQKFIIHITPGQNNYILVHADNTGYRPPNTVALAYMLDGERKEISLQTDLENSQMVEIQYYAN